MVYTSSDNIPAWLTGGEAFASVIYTAAVAITSFAFGLGHILGKSISPMEALSVFVYTGSMGVLFAVVTLKSGSIWNGVVVHGLTNVSEVVISMGFHPEFKSPIVYTFSLETAKLLKDRPYLPNFIYACVAWAVIALLCVRRKKVPVHG